MTLRGIPNRRTDLGWVVHGPTADATLRLICFPYAGGTASVFRSWAAGLPGNIEVCAVQLPGRANRISEPPFTELDALVADVGQTVATHCDIPVAFFGHSLGSIVSFEVARWLRRHHGLLPVHLYVSGRRAPHLSNTEAPDYQKDDDAFLARLAELKGTPPELLANAELLQLVIPTLRADFQLAQTYRYLPGPPLSCPITVVSGREDEECTDARMDAWAQHTVGPFRKHLLDGHHFYLNTNTRALLKVLATDLVALSGAV